MPCVIAPALVRGDMFGLRLDFPEECRSSPGGEVRLLEAPGDLWLDIQVRFVCRARGVGRDKPVPFRRQLVVTKSGPRVGSLSDAESAQ